MPKVSEAHRAARRRQILDAAIACFARDGFHRTSMQDVIAEAQLSPGAIYSYFPGKDDIIEAIADERHAHESALLARALAAPDLRQGLHEVTHAFFEWLKDPLEQRRRRVTIQVWAEALRNPRIAAIVRRGVAQRDPATAAFRAARRRGTLGRNLDPDALSRLMLAIIQGFILQQAWEPGANVDAFVRVLDAMIDATFTPRSRSLPKRRGRPHRGAPPRGSRRVP